MQIILEPIKGKNMKIKKWTIVHVIILILGIISVLGFVFGLKPP